jgi:hypothetical protein
MVTNRLIQDTACYIVIRHTYFHMSCTKIQRERNKLCSLHMLTVFWDKRNIFFKNHLISFVLSKNSDHCLFLNIIKMIHPGSLTVP